MTAQRKIQPELQSGSMCVVMLTAVLSAPDWITVPCINKFASVIMCQKILNYPTDKSIMINSTYLNAIRCAEGVLYI